MSIRCAVVLSAFLAVADRGHAQEGDARAALIAAQGIAEDDPEQAAALLRQALGKVQAMPASSKARRKLESEIDRLLRVVDPNSKRLAKLRSKAATDLVRYLRDYARDEWRDTAMELIRLINQLDPYVTRDEVDALQTELTMAGAAEAKAVGSAPIVEWFRDGALMFREKAWLFSDDMVCSPPFPSSEWGLRNSGLLISPSEVQGDVHIELEILTGVLGRAGFCWNLPGRGQGTKPYYIVELEDVEAGKLLRFGLMRESWEPLTKVVELKMDPFKRHEFVPVTISMNDAVVSVKVGEMAAPIEAPAEFAMNGHLALFVPGSTDNRQGSFFRGLKVEVR